MFTRTALTGLLVVAATAIFPAFAQASFAPSLTLEQPGGTTAGSTAATGLKLTFSGGFEKGLTIGFPAGFLINVNTDGGACLSESGPSPLCQIGSGTINGASEKPDPVTLYLVAPPALADVAGVALQVQGGKTFTGPLTLSTSPTVAMGLSFSTLEAKEGEKEGEKTGAEAINEFQLTLSSPRLPTSCGTATVSVQATDFGGDTASASQPLTVGGCSSLPYNPTVAATVTGEGSAGVQVVVTIKQGSGEDATSGIVFGNPTGVKINKILSPCFNGTVCTVGTVAAESPLLPSSALNTGELTLQGSVNSGSLANQIQGEMSISFPPPYQLSIKGPLNLTEHTITFGGVPDIPLSTLTYTFTGTPAGPAFTSECIPGTIAATLVPQNGNGPVKITGPLTNVNCTPSAGKPTATGSVSGLASGKPKLTVHAVHGVNGPFLESMSIGLASGLSFSHKALAPHKVCKGSGSHRKCKTSIAAKGLSVSGATVASERLSGGKLVIKFTKAASSVSLSARGPLLVESKTLLKKAKKHKAGTLATHVQLTDTTNVTTALSVS
jgi:hypothetical protein